MRTKSALKNIVVSFGAYALLMILGLLVRRMVLYSFDVELVGYGGMLGNLFSLLGIANLGADGVFNYRMYKAFAERNEKRIGKLLGMYKVMFQILGCILTVLCILIFFLLPIIFAGKISQWNYFRWMFVIQACTAISSYFFSYWKSLLIAGQKEYKIVEIESVVQVLGLFAKAVVLWTTRDYLFYLFLTLVFGIAGMIFVAISARKTYPNIQVLKVEHRDFLEEGIVREIRDLFTIKVANAFNLNTDNLIIAFLIDVKTTALYTNYVFVGSNVLTLLTKLTYPLTASIANMLHEGEKERSYRFYKMYNLACGYLAAIIFVCFNVVFQPAITVLFGKQFLLSPGFVFMYSLVGYIAIKNQAIGSFRGVFGEFQVEKNYSIISLITNFTVSFVFGKWWGMPGIIFGTVLANLEIWHSRFVVVARTCFKLRVWQEWIKEAVFFVIVLVEWRIATRLTVAAPFTWRGIIVCGLVGVMVTTGINTIIFCRTQAFHDLIRKVIGITKAKKENS